MKEKNREIWLNLIFIQLAPLIPLVKLSSSIKTPIWRSIPPVKRTFAQNYVRQ